jgi:3-dehydroquinate synthase
MRKRAGVECFLRAVISAADPHRVAAIVVIPPADGDLPDSLRAPAFPVPILVAPAWRVLAQYWSRRFRLFALLDSRGAGTLRVMHRSGDTGLESLSPAAGSLAALLDLDAASVEGSQDVLLGLVSGPDATGRLSAVSAGIAALLESAGRVVEIPAVACTGRFFETWGDDFFDALRNELGKRLGRQPEIVCGNGRAMHLAGAWELARSVTERPGVSVALGRTSAELSITAPHPIRYSTLHPEGYVLDPESPAIAEAVGARPLLAAVDRHIDRLYGADLRAYLDRRTDCRGFVLVEGCEKAKSWEQARLVCDQAIRAGLPRDSVILAVGGGVTLDVAGFAAAIFRRGVRYVRVPTSLIGLVDVGVGIKQAINVGDKKNIVGAFYPPAANINDPTFLSTLPKRHLACGLAEIIKMAVVLDADLFATLEAHARDLVEERFQGPGAARRVLLRAEYLMMRELQGNLFEADLRRLPDFGHTFSPVLETASGYSLAHGEAVAIDMILSTTIAVNRGLCERETLDRLRSLLAAADLPLGHDVCCADLVMDCLDSARAHRGGELNLVVPLGLGTAGFIQDVGRREIEEALDAAPAVAV